MGTLIFTLVLLMGFACLVPAFSQMEISRDEVIEEAARLTGLSKDIMELLYEEAPSLFANVEEVAFQVKVVHLFASAKDQEAILELFNRFVDNLRPVLLSRPLNTFITAVKAYKTSLEVIRDYVLIPALDESIYQSYRASRLIDWKQGDTSAESISTSFEAATTRWGSGYYVVRDKMYRELLRGKGYNENLLGAKMVRYLRSQIDEFWMSVLELRFQQEILRQNEEAITTALWQEAAADLARLRQEALQKMATPSPISTPPSAVTSSSVLEKTETTEDILSAFRSLYPEYLRWYYRTTPSSRVEVIANAEDLGGGRYRLAYRLWQTIQDGPRKGEEVVAVSFEAIRTMGELEASFNSMRESLKQRD